MRKSGKINILLHYHASHNIQMTPLIKSHLKSIKFSFAFKSFPINPSLCAIFVFIISFYFYFLVACQKVEACASILVWVCMRHNIFFHIFQEHFHVNRCMYSTTQERRCWWELKFKKKRKMGKQNFLVCMFLVGMVWVLSLV